MGLEAYMILGGVAGLAVSSAGILGGGMLYVVIRDRYRDRKARAEGWSVTRLRGRRRREWLRG